MQRQKRQGFTLIELLIVIVVILILIGVSFGAYVEMMRHSALQRTNVVLETGKSMYDAYRAADPSMTALNNLLKSPGPSNQLDVIGPGNPTNPPGLAAKPLLMSQQDLVPNGLFLRACKGPHPAGDARAPDRAGKSGSSGQAAGGIAVRHHRCQRQCD
jgi:prepilin-type N-terminal cleavage/methylation domain-containing protein